MSICHLNTQDASNILGLVDSETRRGFYSRGIPQDTEGYILKNETIISIGSKLLFTIIGNKFIYLAIDYNLRVLRLTEVPT